MGWNLKFCGEDEPNDSSLKDLCQFGENVINRYVPNPVTTVINVIETISDFVDIFTGGNTAEASCTELINKGDPCKLLDKPNGVAIPLPLPDRKPDPTDIPPTTIPFEDPLPNPTTPPFTIYDEDNYPQPVITYRYTPIPTLPPNRKQKDKDTSTTVTETLENHKFGCLLHEPFTTTPVKLRTCINVQLMDTLLSDETQSNTLDTFLAYQALKKGLSVPLNVTPNYDDLGVIIWRNYQLSSYESPKARFLFGRSTIVGIATSYNKQNISGAMQIRSMIATDVVVEFCEEDTIQDEPLNTTLSTNTSVNECMIPVRNFKDNHAVGYKRQLQLTFEMRTLDGIKVTKEITLPDPKDDLTAEKIKAVLSTIATLIGTSDDTGIYIPFGNWYKAEQTVVSNNVIGYFRYYGGLTSESNPYDASAIFNELIKLCNGTLKDDFKFTKRDTPYVSIKHTGYIKPKAAYIFDFKDNDNPDCIRFSLS